MTHQNPTPEPEGLPSIVRDRHERYWGYQPSRHMYVCFEGAPTRLTPKWLAQSCGPLDVIVQ